MTETGDNLTPFFNKRSGSTVYCGLEEEVQFYHFIISERAQNLSYHEAKANVIDRLASNEIYSLKHCLRISDYSFIGRFVLGMCYVSRSDLARDVADSFNPTYKIECCDWI